MKKKRRCDCCNRMINEQKLRYDTKYKWLCGTCYRKKNNDIFYNEYDKKDQKILISTLKTDEVFYLGLNGDDSGIIPGEEEVILNQFGKEGWFRLRRLKKFLRLCPKTPDIHKTENKGKWDWWPLR